MNLTRVYAISKKEFKHLFRDVRLLSILLLFPVLLLIMFGYAVNFDVQHVKLGVVDNNKSELSRGFVHSLHATNYFNLVTSLDNIGEIQPALDRKLVQCVIVIPNDFTERFRRGQDAPIQYLVDGVDGNTAKIIQGYMEAATMQYNKEQTGRALAKLSGMSQPEGVVFEPRFWYNPTLKTTLFLIPGLISMILIITATISVSLSLVRERERGTMEQINVSPVQGRELLIGKIIPYLLLALVNAVFILIAGYVLFGAGVAGSFLWLFITTLFFLFSATSLGIFVSAVSNSQQVAFTIATFVSLLPSLILSGFIFQIESMPEIIQYFTVITPTTFYNRALRAIMLRGVGVEAFWEQLAYLVIYALLLLFAAFRILQVKAKNA